MTVFEPFLTEVFDHMVVHATKHVDNPAAEAEYEHLFMSGYWEIAAEVLANHPTILPETYKALLVVPTGILETCSIGPFALYSMEPDETLSEVAHKHGKLHANDEETDVDLLLLKVVSKTGSERNLCLVIDHDRILPTESARMFFQ